MIKPSNLLIVRADRIGDVVLSLPLARIIKKYYPECKITFLVREYTKNLVLNHPFIDNVLVLKEDSGQLLIRENKKLIAGNKFDSCVVVSPTFEISLIIYLSRIRERIGTGYRWYSFFFNNKVYQHRKYAEKHELEFNVQMLKNLGIDEKIDRQTVQFDLNVREEDCAAIDKFLREENIDSSKKIIIIHPGSGGSAMDLPVEKFRELALQLAEKKDIEIFITGSENERDLCEAISSGTKIKNFAGRLNLGELTALISKADLFIANSTGPLHIAAALGRDLIGFYPKITACLPERWGPYSEKSVVFKPDIECSDCTREQCEKLQCMNSIDINDVIRAIEIKLNNKAEK